ncbi:amino acid ABC transporter permease [Bacillus atrophaeus]|uniref:Glutamine ABC transporter (Permease) n=1 Tax=Bacillus atrophaeus (strain 1942) TaxID=720555 RepID=A0ABN3ZBN9_BACA1|nr:amino acid ABC transporter permease [Bacillus atrophaeus]AMR62015.1 glutamine ABC transporter permease [Bacillus subtilis subsp. globigii]ADP33220.1 glutamine ABC transporter (permease) [Bacillus atrophaeus 1942]AIK49263.1 amino ABC transporter, permease, 3-TM region, His/Glu/Gln/Arg/opine family domain protein [Bacillus atrophaeus subsp. globigii]EIM12480.1 glutamine ABC transporter permease [Bacillus atrophaeus C89]KFK83574.1 amino ABC transporter, permease, 3-TM region, His/Glu/Gln/Arg/o
MNFIEAYSSDHLTFLLDGFLVTLYVAFISIVLSFMFGGVIGTLRYANIPIVSNILAVAVETIRNLPLLLIIFFTYFALPEIGIKLEITAAAITALTIFESAMLSEIIRSGLKSVEKGQTEAARSSGLSYVQTLFLIIMPQALRRMVPPIVSQFISLLKDTSLAVVIALPELIHNAQIINGQSADSSYFFPIFLLAAFMYFAVNYSLSLAARKLELKQM